MGFCYQSPEAWIRSIDVRVDVFDGKGQQCSIGKCESTAWFVGGWRSRGKWRSKLLCGKHAKQFADRHMLFQEVPDDDSFTS